MSTFIVDWNIQGKQRTLDLERYLQWVDDVVGLATFRRNKEAALGFAMRCAGEDLKQGGGPAADLHELAAYVRAQGFCVDALP